jgi:hypothetical protein
MTASKRRRILWTGWGLLTAAIIAYLTVGMLWEPAAANPVLSPARALLLPGRTMHGHYQIELACESCHTKAFGGPAPMQEACVKCHGAALKEANDTHPSSKFDDPRNAERLEKLDAQACITCHVEHRPAITHGLGVTQPKDFCFHCHSGKEEMPPDHKGFKFDGCTAAGCHNFHDNRALYEDFQLKHLHEPKNLAKALLPKKELAAALRESAAYPAAKYPFRALTAAEQDAPAGAHASPAVQADWLATAHAQAGVNCSGCHAADGPWRERPAPAVCKTCHAIEARGFAEGLHGMRTAQNLPAMTPGQARAPMRPDAAHRELTCNACHAAHRFDVKAAAVESCLGCHNDPHTLAYKASPHFRLWQDELAGRAPPGSGVSCASCHLPRMRMPTDEGARIAVQHNQSDALRPNSKMVRPVCMQCHGLEFAIDALADPALINGNFKGMPARHVESADMAEKRDAEKRRKRAQSSK